MIESAKGKIQDVVAFRLPPGTDVLQGILEVCKQYDIKNGVILSALGSWKKAAFCNPITLPNGKSGYGETTILDGNGFYELLSFGGMISHDDRGNILPHIHLTISDERGSAYGGHLVEGCEVLITTDIVIGILDDIIMGRRFDEAAGVPLFAPRNVE